MFRENTVFIVGAGASKEAGLPTGAELKTRISDLIDIKFDGFNQISGDRTITECLREHVRQPDRPRGDINPYLHAAWQICAALPQAISIDNYIDARRDEKIELCGKLGIVKSILDAERNSLLFVDPVRDRPNVDYESLRATWYTSFMQLLTEGVTIDEVEHIFRNISIITFNYDRCIEHFLFHALRTYFGIDEARCIALLQSLRVFHPYGAVGTLPWQVGGDGVGFGANRSDLLNLAGQIRTFTECLEDAPEVDAMRNRVKEAEVVVFLGFAFHRLNMELITPRAPTKATRIYATAKGISKSDCDVVQGQIAGFLGRETRGQFSETTVHGGMI
jgi:hypothetical protein